MHSAQVGSRPYDHQRNRDFLPGGLVFLLLVDIFESTSGVISTRAFDAFGAGELVAVMLNGIVFLEFGCAGFRGAFGALEIHFGPYSMAHGLNHSRCCGCGEEGPMVVGSTCSWVCEYVPLFFGRNDVDDDRGCDFV